MSDKPRPRFFIEHGVIHDRATGKHVRTSDNGPEDGIDACCALLNQLAAERDDAFAMLGRGVELFDGCVPEHETVSAIVTHLRTVYALNKHARGFADLIERGDWKAKP